MRGATRAICASIAAQRSSRVAAILAPSRARDPASSDERAAYLLVHERRERVGCQCRLRQHSRPSQDLRNAERCRARRVPLHVGGGLRDLFDALRRDGKRRRTRRSPGERDPAFDLAAPEFRRDALAQRGFLAADLVGKADREVEVAMIDAAEVDGEGNAGLFSGNRREPGHAENHGLFFTTLCMFSGYTCSFRLPRMYALSPCGASDGGHAGTRIASVVDGYPPPPPPCPSRTRPSPGAISC